MAVVVLVVVAVAGVVGIPVVLARRRARAPTTTTTVWTATTRRPPWLEQTAPDTAAEPTAPADQPSPEDPTPAPDRESRSARATSHDTSHAPSGPCDWELRLATGGHVTVIRRAHGHPCCVHTLSLAWQDWPPGTAREHQGLTWSGDETRTDPSGASSRTRRARATHRVTPRGPGVRAEATIVREPGPEITTPWAAASEGPAGRTPGTDRLWTAHTRALRAAGARSRPDDMTVTTSLDVVDRLHLRVDVERGCPTGGHHLVARARTGIEVTGTVRGAADARSRLPAVAAWADGDLDVAATRPVSTSAGTTVLPLARDAITPVPSGHQHAVTVDGDVDTDVTTSLVGAADTTEGDGGLDLRLGSMALFDLALGAVDRTSAKARLDVTLHHRVAVLVTPPAGEPGCACQPSWGLQLGGEVLAEPSTSPLGRLVLDDRVLVLHRATDVGPPGAVWAVPSGT